MSKSEILEFIYDDNFISIFYEIYSTVTLIVCYLLSPVIFYIILTQSKSLDNLKYILLNQAFWCLCLETLVGLVKPVILSPYPGGYQIGFFSEIGDYYLSAYLTIFCLIFTANSIISLLIAIFSRYLIIFPSRFQHIFNRKDTYVVLALFYISLDVVCFIGVYKEIRKDNTTLYRDPVRDNQDLQQFFDRPTWFYTNRVSIKKFALFGFIIVTFFIVFSIVIIVMFLYQIQDHTKKFSINNSIQRSLIINCVSETIVTIVFLVLPFLFLLMFMTFEIQHTATSLTVLFCVLSTHCLADFIMILVSITPYRRWILNIFVKKCKVIVVPSNQERSRY